MATYYFDTNGNTAGFGTLTGNWNPTTALWSTSSAGTAATAAVTFTNVDVAQFGFAGTTGTAGTATITVGITNTVNQVVTANLAGLQTIAGPGTLEFAGSNPTLNSGASGNLLISAPIAGTTGFTKTGTALATLTSTTSTITGDISVTGAGGLNAGLFLGASTGGAGAACNVFAGSGGGVYPVLKPVAAGDWIRLAQGNTPVTLPNYAFTGAGGVSLLNTATGGTVTFPVGSFANLTGAGGFSGSNTAIVPTAGFVMQSWSASATAANTAILKDLPVGLTYFHTRASVSGTDVVTAKYDGTLVSPPLAKIWLATTNNALVADASFVFEASQAGGGGVVDLTGGIERGNDNGGTFKFTLSGTGLGNKVSGAILAGAGAGALAITKAGTGSWIFSGTNTYNGGTTVSVGTLVAQNNSALGSSALGAVSVTAGATLEISSGFNVTKTSQQLTLNGNAAANGALYCPSGSATYTASAFALGSNTAIKADAGATLTLTSTGAITGAFTLSHIGTGTAVLTQTAASSFSILSIQSGTVSVSAALANGGSNSGIGAGAAAASNWLIGSTASAGTFQYTGAACSSNRNFTIGTAGCTFESSGTGVLTLTGTTPAFSGAGACTLTLSGTAGTAATPNTTAMVLPNNGAAVVGLTKTGVGAWEISGVPTYTGTTTVTGGSLAFAESNLGTNVLFDGPGALRKVVLNGVSKTITCSAGASDVAEMVATNSSNTITGTTAINTGTLKLTTEATAASKPVKVLGDTNVTVTSKLQTSTGTLQRGQMRYGGNLTFQAGSTFIIGG